MQNRLKTLFEQDTFSLTRKEKRVFNKENITALVQSPKSGESCSCGGGGVCLSIDELSTHLTYLGFINLLRSGIHAEPSVSQFSSY